MKKNGMNKRLTLGVMLAAAALSFAAHAEEDVLARAKATYAALNTYSDTGSMVVEFGTDSSERHTFTTRFRKPRHFYFQFDEDPKAGAEKYLIWSDDQQFNTWWSTTAVHNTYGKGKGIQAFIGANATRGSALYAAPWLFPGAGLNGAFSEFTDATLDGTEMINGRKCYRLKGMQRSFYGATGHEVAPRRMTMWIDAETYLVRKIFQDTPRGTPKGNISRTTAVFEPVANPKLADKDFVFVPPEDDD